MKTIQPADLKMIVLLYYEKTELSNVDIEKLFNCSKSTAQKLKKRALEKQKEVGRITFCPTSVDTECAFEAWNIDIEKCEQKLKRLFNIKNKYIKEG